MGRTLFLGPNYVDVAGVTADGGSFVRPMLPSNVLSKSFARVARTTDCRLSSTRIWIDLGQPRAIKGVAVPWFTASTVNRALKARATGYSAKSESSTLKGTTGWTDVYPVIYREQDLTFEDPHWLDGKLTPEEAAAARMPFFAVFDTAVIAQYWLLELDDRGSELGYVEVPRVFLCPGWQPAFPVNLKYGSSLGIEPRTQVEESWGGTEYFDVQTPRRVVRFGFEYLPEDEAMSLLFDLQNSLGVDGQMFFSWNPDDTIHRHRRSFAARFRVLSQFEAVKNGFTGAAGELIEVIA